MTLRLQDTGVLWRFRVLLLRSGSFPKVQVCAPEYRPLSERADPRATGMDTKACYAEEPRGKRVHSVWFHVCEILKQAKLGHGDKSERGPRREGGDIACQGVRGNCLG